MSEIRGPTLKALFPFSLGANGLIKSFERRQTENPLLLYLDRDCLLFIKGFHFWF